MAENEFKPRSAKDILARNMKAAAEQPKQLPLWDDLQRAMPNVIARSSLFSPIKRGKRPYLRDARISSRSDISVLYSGEQLDMADCDVFLQALDMAKQAPLGQPIRFNRGAFLKAINKSRGKSDYEWLNSAIKRLQGAVVEIIPQKGPSYSFQLLGKRKYDPDQEEYFLEVDPDIVQAFSGSQYGLIDWQARFSLSHQVDLAKWLQGYLASHAKGIHRVSILNLQEWSGRQSSRSDHFKTALIQAADELIRVGAIKSATIKESGVVEFDR